MICIYTVHEGRDREVVYSSGHTTWDSNPLGQVENPALLPLQHITSSNRMLRKVTFQWSLLFNFQTPGMFTRLWP